MKQPVRLNLQLSPETGDVLTDLSDRQSVTKAELLKKSITLLKVVTDETNKGADILLHNAKTGQTTKIVGLVEKERSGPVPVVIHAAQAKLQAQVYASVMITSLEDMLRDRLGRFHNMPPEEMKLQDDEFIKTAKKLIAELKKLNKTLDTNNENTKISERNKIEFAKHMNKFLDNCAGVAGKGTGLLVVAAGASLLTYVGASPDLAASLLNRLK